MQENFNNQLEPGAEESSMDLRKVLNSFLKNWPWFVFAVIGAMIIAFFYLRYSTPEYNVRATVLIQDDKKGGTTPDNALLMDLGLAGKSNVDNEVQIFKSRTLMEKVVRDLQLYVQYFTQGKVKSIERYQDKSFQMFFVPLFEDSVRQSKTYTFKPNGNQGFTLSDEQNEWKGQWNDTLNIPIGRALFMRTFLPLDENETYTIVVNNPEITVTGYMNRLAVDLANKQVSIINLTLQSPVMAKGESVLNKLIQVYMQSNVDDKNRIADSTMRFIDDRLALVGQELTGIEKDIENFKEVAGLTDLSAQSQQLITSTSDYVKDLTEQQVQLSVVQSLENYLNDNDKRVVPSSLVVQDPTFSSLINNYNSLQLEREKLLMSSTENNPLVKNLDQRLSSVRIDLKNSLASIKKSLQIRVSELVRHTGRLTSEMRAVPAKERIFLEKSREQSIKQELYLFLLKKREETAISKSSTIANARIVDPAKSDFAPFKPKTQLIYLSAFLIGLILPAGVIYLRQMLNTRIMDKADITDRTNTPVVAEISHSDSPSPVVITASSRTIVAEQFRGLRTNLQFMLPGKDQKVILLTSCISGEGKSFVSINLASTLAITGKRVLLMELDLRKPKISTALGIDGALGFSSFAIGQAELKQVIIPSGHQESLYVLPAGALPPNPAELLMLPKTKDLFDVLRENFDYIIVDTPPVSLVTDAQLLAKFADASLFVVRQAYSFKPQMSLIEDLYRSKKLPNLSIIVNDVKAGQGYGYNYSYGYGYGYGYAEAGNGYFDNGQNGKKKKSFLQRFKK